MAEKQGGNTGAFGRWLTDSLTDTPALRVVYDHGDSHEQNVAEAQAFCGNKITRENRLAAVDILIAEGDEVRCLIEIEESPISPKGILGDVMAVMMANNIAVKRDAGHDYFRITPRSRLIVAGWVPANGIRLSRIEKILLPRLRLFGGLTDGIKPENIELIFTDSIDATIRSLKSSRSGLLG